MAGCVGCDAIPLNGQPVAAWNVGTVYHNCIPNRMERRQDETGRSILVEALDGLLLATQYDIPWREDLFDGWDYYDVSQCLEMQRAGYQVVVPYQESPWCYHDNSYSKMRNYWKYCERMIQEYQDIKAFSMEAVSEPRRELEEIKEQSRAELRRLVDMGDKEGLLQVFANPDNRGWLHLKEFEVLSDIVTNEQAAGAEHFWQESDDYSMLHSRINELHMTLKRIEFGAEGEEPIWADISGKYSLEAVKVVLSAYTQDAQNEWSRLEQKSCGSEEYALLQEQKKQEWAERYEELGKHYLAFAAARVEGGTTEDRNELIQAFQNPVFLKNFSEQSPFAELDAVINIYRKEVEAGIYPTIFDSTDSSIPALQEHLKGLKLALWRILFVGDEEEKDMLYEYIIKHQVSKVMLQYVISGIEIDSHKIQELLREWGMW
jgi:hypothetical protein